MAQNDENSAMVSIPKSMESWSKHTSTAKGASLQKNIDFIAYEHSMQGIQSDLMYFQLVLLQEPVIGLPKG